MFTHLKMQLSVRTLHKFSLTCCCCCCCLCINPCGWGFPSWGPIPRGIPWGGLAPTLLNIAGGWLGRGCCWCCCGVMYMPPGTPYIWGWLFWLLGVYKAIMLSVDEKRQWRFEKNVFFLLLSFSFNCTINKFYLQCCALNYCNLDKVFY